MRLLTLVSASVEEHASWLTTRACDNINNTCRGIYSVSLAYRYPLNTRKQQVSSPCLKEKLVAKKKQSRRKESNSVIRREPCVNGIWEYENFNFKRHKRKEDKQRKTTSYLEEKLVGEKKIAWKEWKSAIVKKPYVNGLVNMRTLILDVTNEKEINK